MTISVRENVATRDRMIRTLQALESHLSFSLGGRLRRVRWDEVTADWLAETPEEQAAVGINSLKQTFHYPVHPVPLVPDEAARIVGAVETHGHLAERKAFWREATREFETSRYVQAYYGFYFVLEDAYANGKTGKREVLRAFQANHQFAALCNKQLSITFADRRHGSNLRALFAEEGCDTDAAGLQELLYSLRGRLHHFHSRSSRVQATPFTQRDFETPAWVAMGLATTTILADDLALPHRL